MEKVIIKNKLGTVIEQTKHDEIVVNKNLLEIQGQSNGFETYKIKQPEPNNYDWYCVKICRCYRIRIVKNKMFLEGGGDLFFTIEEAKIAAEQRIKQLIEKDNAG